MTKLKLVLVLLLSGFLLACNQDFSPQSATIEELAKGGNGKGKGKPIVEEPVAEPVPPCVALYSSDGAQATLSNAVVDPNLTYGSVGTLILSFNFEDALAPAASFITSTLGLEQGKGLGVFENLPMLAISTLITPEVVGTLKTNLQGHGLLSIYQDRALEYFLDESVAFIKADAARKAFNVTGKGVGVGVIDSGIDGTQGDFPTLVKNVKIVGSIFSSGVSGALYVDTPNSDLTSGHGTHVAGTIAGSGAMSDGKYVGVAPGANLVGVGAGDAISILYALQGFNFLFQPDIRETYNVRVISNSWGTSGSRFAPYNPISIASKRAYDLGMVVNFAAGNDGRSGNDTLNPYSASPCVISVGAGHAKNTMNATSPLIRKGKPGELADFSSRGVPGDEFHHPDIVLPGVNIVAARAASGAIVPPYTGFNGDKLEPSYSSISGTSMATPHMSGLTALILEVNPKLNLDGVLKAVTSTADPMYAMNADGTARQLELHEVGAGYANAYAAVQKAVSTAGARYTTTTSPLASWTGTVGLAVDEAGIGSEHNYTLSVPSGASALRVEADWGNPAYDLDLYVYDPSGKLVASSAVFATPSEAVAIPNPGAGSYRVQLKGWLNGPTPYTGTAEIDVVTSR